MHQLIIQQHALHVLLDLIQIVGQQYHAQSVPLLLSETLPCLPLLVHHALQVSQLLYYINIHFIIKNNNNNIRNKWFW